MPPIDTIQDAIQGAITPNTQVETDGRAKLKEAGFSQEVIDGLGDELINRFENALPIYQRGVEGNLALREALSLQHVEAGEATSEQLTTALETFINAHPDSIVQTVTQTAQQQIDTFTEQGEQRLTTWIENQLNERPFTSWIAGIVDISASDITQYGIDKVSGNGGGFSLIAILFALSGLGKSDMFKNHIDSLSSFTPRIQLDNQETLLDPTQGDGSGGDTSEINTTNIEHNPEKELASVLGGYTILSFMSGNQNIEDSDSLAVYEILGEKSILEIRDSYSKLEYVDGRVKPGEILRVFGIEGSGDDEIDHLNTIKGIVGPYTDSFLSSMFVPSSNIQDTIFKTDSTQEFSSAALEIFTPDELTLIQNTSNFQSLKLNILSRLTVVYSRKFYSHTSSHVQSAIGQVSTTVKDFIFGEETKGLFDNLSPKNEEDNIYPSSVSDVFAAILSGNQFINSNVHSITTGRSFEDLSDSDIERVSNIIDFRNQITQVIPAEFSLGIPGFEARFASELNYGKVLSLYMMLGGKNLHERSEMDDVIIYTWVYNLFEGSNQGLYESAVLEAVSGEDDTISENQKNMLTVVLFRAVEANRNGYIEGVARVATFGHEVVKNQILGSVPVSDRVKDYLAYTLEMGGAYAIWRILALFPTTRAVLFVTGGVTLGAILLLSREGIYKGLSSEIQAEFDAFLVSNYGGNGEAATIIRERIQNGETGVSDLMSGLNNLVEGSLGNHTS